MIKLECSSPNTIGVYYSEEFDGYPEDKIERMCERLVDSGWEISELPGSTSKSGTIECTHDNYADIKLIQWETI